MHHNEADKPTNTGRLAALALINSEVRVRGVKDARMSTDGIVIPGRRTVVLYPHETSTLLEQSAEPVTLVVPDANWNQAARIVRREPVLAALPRVHLGNVTAAAVQARTSTRADGLSTIEAIAEALELLGESGAKPALLALFRTFVEGTLASRGVRVR